jgi:prevent-host-death family protein
MKNIQASEFKAKCLKIMDEVAKTGEEVVITKNGKAISKLVPYKEPVSSLFGIHAGQLSIRGDILAPIDTEWNANR